MPAASTPACRCELPSVAEMLCASCGMNDSGSAPYCSWLASSSVSRLVNWPVIRASPGMHALDDRRGHDGVVQHDRDGLALVACRLPRFGARC